MASTQDLIDDARSDEDHPRRTAGEREPRQETLPEIDASEVRRRAAAFVEELMAIGEVGQALARREALNSVRMERAADQQAVALTQQIRQAVPISSPLEGPTRPNPPNFGARPPASRRSTHPKEATLARRH